MILVTLLVILKGMMGVMGTIGVSMIGVGFDGMVGIGTMDATGMPGWHFCLGRVFLWVLF
jgi:hypothetical protein